MKQGIYTLANDNVYDQLVALLNSIEANYSKDIPVCVIPYDDNAVKVEADVERRKNCSIFTDKEIIKKWEKFALEVWGLECGAGSMETFGRHKLSVHRKLCCFDGPFDKFVFMDADTLLMQSLDFIFEKLENHDFVVYDYQFKDPSHVFNINSKKLNSVFSEKRLKKEIFCTGFWASKKEIFTQSDLSNILKSLEEDEKKILYARAPEQSLLNYMCMKSNKPIYNFAVHLDKSQRTGNCVVSAHFKERDHILYDKDVGLTYLHYIGIPADIITRVCAGEDIDFPYKDIFLYYRYLYREGHKASRA